MPKLPNMYNYPAHARGGMGWIIIYGTDCHQVRFRLRGFAFRVSGVWSRGPGFGLIVAFGSRSRSVPQAFPRAFGWMFGSVLFSVFFTPFGSIFGRALGRFCGRVSSRVCGRVFRRVCGRGFGPI